MSNAGEKEKQDQLRWQERFARGRLGLSASVEEVLAHPDLEEDDLDDSGDEQVVVGGIDRAGGRSDSSLIRPRLSLQSRPLPAVQAHPNGLLATTNTARALLTTGTPSAAQSDHKKKRLAGRNTRVELQAIAKQEKKAAGKTRPLAERTEAARVVVMAESPAQIKEAVTEVPSAVKVKQMLAPVHQKLSGTGVFLKGRVEATVENGRVSPASIVLVTLLGNPGPVVVHYTTVLPGYGFTVHLSDAAAADTPFNYAILLGELL